MTIVTARITVAPDGTISGHVPADIPAGEHRVEITLVDGPVRRPPTVPFNVDDLPVHDFGPWPEGLSLRREDIYGDDGR